MRTDSLIGSRLANVPSRLVVLARGLVFANFVHRFYFYVLNNLG